MKWQPCTDFNIDKMSRFMSILKSITNEAINGGFGKGGKS